jgi:hypothetical protein
MCRCVSCQLDARGRSVCQAVDLTMRWSERPPAVRSRFQWPLRLHCEQRALSVAVAHLVLVRSHASRYSSTTRPSCRRVGGTRQSRARANRRGCSEASPSRRHSSPASRLSARGAPPSPFRAWHRRRHRRCEDGSTQIAENGAEHRTHYPGRCSSSCLSSVDFQTRHDSTVSYSGHLYNDRSSAMKDLTRRWRQAMTGCKCFKQHFVVGS